MSLTKPSLIINLFPARESLVSDIPAGDGKIENLFLQCSFGLANKDIPISKRNKAIDIVVLERMSNYQYMAL
jgi:hypothetical protein